MKRIVAQMGKHNDTHSNQSSTLHFIQSLASSYNYTVSIIASSNSYTVGIIV